MRKHDWQIIAPHLRETTEEVDDPYEGFLGGWPSCLAELLAVPIVPDDFYLDCSDRIALSDSRYVHRCDSRSTLPL